MATQPKPEGVPVPTVIISVIAVFVAGLLIGGFVLKFGKKKGEATDCVPPGTTGATAKRYRIMPRPYMPAKGPRAALVTVIATLDFQSPVAKKAFQNLKQLGEAYKKDVRIVAMHNPNPRRPDARLAAVASMAAKRQGKFWQYADKLFANPRALKKQNLLAYAKQLGMDEKKFHADLDNRMTGRYVRQDQQVLIRLGARQTPAFFVNGVYQPGAPDVASLKKLVSAELANAKKIVKTGVARAQLYRHLMRNALARIGAGPNPAGRRGNRPNRPREDPKAVYKVDISNRPFKGPKNAKVTIVEWSDFQCGWCKRLLPTFKQIHQAYPKDVKVVWMDFPLRFHRQAMPGAIAAYEVWKQKGNDTFWKYHDKVFENGKNITDANLAKWAKELGADDKKVLAALKNKTHEKTVRAAMSLGMRLGVRGTPTVIVNGRKFMGRRDFPNFKRMIDAEIKKANAQIGKAGVTVASYYSHIQKAGLNRVKYLPGTGGAQPGGRGRARQPRRRLDPNAVYAMPITGKEPFKGPKDALVTVVEYSDYQCPYCKWAACIVNLVAKQFPKDVKFVFKNNPLPFHKDAMPAAEAALAAFAQKGNAGFWAMHDKLFPTEKCSDKAPMPHIRQWLRQLPRPGPKLNLETFTKYATAIGLDVARFKKDFESHKFQAQIKAEQALANKLGARGTPAFFINGKYVRGVRPFATFKAMIEKEIAEAKKIMAAKKVPLAKLYETIIAKGATAPVYLDKPTGPGKPNLNVRRLPGRR